jgi:hypothetical protein
MARGAKRNPGHVTPDASLRQRGGKPGGVALEAWVRDMEPRRGIEGNASRLPWKAADICANDKSTIILSKGSCAKIYNRLSGGVYGSAWLSAISASA